MMSIFDAQLEEVAAIVGAEGFNDEQLEARLVAFVRDPMLARRLMDWLPEAFGMVLVSHMDTVSLPTTFSAKNNRGDWVEFDLTVEPIFASAIRLATHMLHNGPRDTFSNIALRSAMVEAANRALNAGESLKGASLSGPALTGIPAETYLSPCPSIWRKLFR